MKLDYLHISLQKDNTKKHNKVKNEIVRKLVIKANEISITILCVVSKATTSPNNFLKLS